MSLLDRLLTLENGILSLTVWALIVTLKKLTANGSRWQARSLPVLPVVLGVVGSMLGLGSGRTLPEKIAIGIIFGTIAGQGFKIGRTSILGRGLPVTKLGDDDIKRIGVKIEK